MFTGASAGGGACLVSTGGVGFTATGAGGTAEGVKALVTI